MRRHDTDVVSLLAGLLFVAVAAAQLLASASDVELDGQWVLPMLLVLLGLVGLASAVRGSRSTEQPAGGGREDPAEMAATDTNAVGADEGTTRP